MKDLDLVLKGEYFNRIAEGRKRYEFRLVKPYWTKRLEGKTFDRVCFRLGYSWDAPFLIMSWRKCTRRKWKGVEYYVIELGPKIFEGRCGETIPFN
jgi:hypothetical protein